MFGTPDPKHLRVHDDNLQKQRRNIPPNRGFREDGFKFLLGPGQNAHPQTERKRILSYQKLKADPNLKEVSKRTYESITEPEKEAEYFNNKQDVREDSVGSEKSVVLFDRKKEGKILYDILNEYRKLNIPNALKNGADLTSIVFPAVKPNSHDITEVLQNFGVVETQEKSPKPVFRVTRKGDTSVREETSVDKSAQARKASKSPMSIRSKGAYRIVKQIPRGSKMGATLGIPPTNPKQTDYIVFQTPKLTYVPSQNAKSTRNSINASHRPLVNVSSHKMDSSRQDSGSRSQSRGRENSHGMKSLNSFGKFPQATSSGNKGPQTTNEVTLPPIRPRKGTNEDLPPRPYAPKNRSSFLVIQCCRSRCLGQPTCCQPSCPKRR